MSKPTEPDIVSAAADLAATIKSENAALAALDFRTAVLLLERKQLHGQAFMAAQARTLANELHGISRTQLRQLAGELGELSAENKRLLERAMVVQGRVIASLARAVPRARAAIANVHNYAADGRPARSWSPSAVALSARA